jgi:anhydro-N-acetylmuramic acid kinase
MSGTSLDAVDTALVSCASGDIQLRDCLEVPISRELRERIHALSHPGEDEIGRLGRLDRELGFVFGDAVKRLLSIAGVEASRIRAIGSHGQTVRHYPPSASNTPREAFTVQIGDPNTIAELTGITTVADFRRRDLAAGGEGAPLVPAFHAAAFSHPEKSRAIVNIGGIANVSLLFPGELSGFDTGPGNTLLDQWILRCRGEMFDPLGSWAAEGEVEPELLESLLAEEYFARPPPKSTGKETFNLGWLDSILDKLGPITDHNVQTTLAEFTAASICDAIRGCGMRVDEVYVCGGGAANTDLMRRLYRRLAPLQLGTTEELGVSPAWVEAAAFAWLAWRTLRGLPGNVPDVSGARGDRILGAVYPGSPEAWHRNLKE